MKIINVTTYVLFEPFSQQVVSGRGNMAGRDIILTEIRTDDGETGISYITGLHMAGGAEIKIIELTISEALFPCILGENPQDTQRLWDKMYTATRRFGRRGAVLRAISAVDMALWDIIGKSAGKPISKLLGGNSDQIPFYVSGGHYSPDPELAREMEDYLKKGYQAIKIRVGGASLKRDTERLELVRSVIGDDVTLMVDAGEAWDVSTAVRAAVSWEKFNLLFIEEPISSDNLEGLRHLRQKTAIPIALGENLYTRFDFRNLITMEAADIMQPDVSRVGGITEWIRVAHLASAYDIKIAPHGMQEIHASLLGAINNAMMVEFFDRDHQFQKLIDELFLEPVSAKTVSDNHMQVPGGTGLGLHVDWDTAKRVLVSQTSKTLE